MIEFLLQILANLLSSEIPRKRKPILRYLRKFVSSPRRHWRLYLNTCGTGMATEMVLHTMIQVNNFEPGSSKAIMYVSIMLPFSILLPAGFVHSLKRAID